MFKDESGPTFAVEEGDCIQRIHLSYACADRLDGILLGCPLFRESTPVWKRKLEEYGLSYGWIDNNISEPSNIRAIISGIIFASCFHGELSVSDLAGYTALAMILEGLMRNELIGLADSRYACKVIVECPLINPKKTTSQKVVDHFGRDVTYEKPMSRASLSAELLKLLDQA
jgi:hypothetical protein